MRAHSPTHRRLVTTVFVTLVSGCSGGDGPTAPSTPPPGPTLSSASFEISSAGQTRRLAYDSSRNTVFCSRSAGWASLWIRLAEQATANGENGPHIDLDLCNHSGGGTFTPQDPSLGSCAGGKTFDLFWHAEDGSTFANQPVAGNCMLQFTQNGIRLTGTFACRGLAERGGTRTVDVSNGVFECTEA